MWLFLKSELSKKLTEMNSNKPKNAFMYKTTATVLKVIQEKVEKTSEGRFLEDSPTGSSGMQEKGNTDVKEKSKRNSGVFKNRAKGKINLGQGASYDQCFAGNSFSSQYEDECPVNYSLKYSETESCKGTSKPDEKKKFKDYSDYAETDLDQPTDFSLKYAEKTCDEENKNTEFNFYDNDEKYKEFNDYVETDLDQPTDFTLKYRESAEEDKNIGFNFYENEKPKVGFDAQTESEDASCQQIQEGYTCELETPLMFSRCSSMNSLSSFIHITQSIPDDRSSVVSDFSRMTSGIISPSELPDTPTQTAPSSPKRQKPPVTFPAKPVFMAKPSVFEDDIATYKQEDTPIEFSRATSLSSLNLENPVKSELMCKINSRGSSVLGTKEETASRDQIQSDQLKQRLVPKIEPEKGKFDLAPAVPDRLNIVTQINCRKSKQPCVRLVRQDNGFLMKPNLRLKFANENGKVFSTYEGSDDVLHTYHTEGTPANISHAGSHSDLSALTVSTGILGVDDNFDDEAFQPERILADLTQLSIAKAETCKNVVKIFNGGDPVGKISVDVKSINRSVYLNSQSQLDYLRKDPQLTAKDETATFATENSPCNFSIRSSLSDLTVSVIDPPLNINRNETSEEPPSEMITPLHNVSPQSPNSIVFGELENAEKVLEEADGDYISSDSLSQQTNYWDTKQSPANEAEEENAKSDPEIAECSRVESPDSTNFDFDSSQPLTPFEEALLEECIRLGMPQRKMNQKVDEFSGMTETTEGKGKYWNGKKNNSESRIDACGSTCDGADLNSLTESNFDFDSNEPLTPFEEVLLERCIRLGMPQKKSLRKVEGKSLEGESLEYDSSGQITPLETALLEQCIRLGMPQKKNHKRGEAEESHKVMSGLVVHLNRMKISSENDKEKEGKKCAQRHRTKRHVHRRHVTWLP